MKTKNLLKIVNLFTFCVPIFGADLTGDNLGREMVPKGSSSPVMADETQKEISDFLSVDTSRIKDNATQLLEGTKRRGSKTLENANFLFDTIFNSYTKGQLCFGYFSFLLLSAYIFLTMDINFHLLFFVPLNSLIIKAICINNNYNYYLSIIANVITIITTLAIVISIIENRKEELVEREFLSKRGVEERKNLFEKEIEIFTILGLIVSGGGFIYLKK